METIKKIGKWLLDKWLGSFLSGLIILLIKLYIDLPKESKDNFLKFEWLNKLLVISIPIWQMLLVCGLVILLPYLKKRLLKTNVEVDEYSFLEEPKIKYEFLKYRKDTFGQDKIEWTWNYEWQPYERKYHIIDLVPSCPNCSTPLEKVNFGYGIVKYDCSYCRLNGKPNHTFNIAQLESDISKEIVRRANSGII